MLVVQAVPAVEPTVFVVATVAVVVERRVLEQTALSQQVRDQL
jgi:hypothetical protein